MVGLELEFIDADRRSIRLPEGCSFNKKEVTLVNSNGVAVDSTGKTGRTIGGEINTKPTETISEQLEIAKECIDQIKENGGGVNYRCNLHVHYSLPEKQQTLENLKRVQKYAYENFKDIIMLTMGEGQFTKKPEYPTSFWSHYKERMVPEYKHKFIMESKSLKDFQMSFFKSKAGTHAPLTFMRQLINTHSFFKTKTIENRGFWGTLDLKEIRNCLDFHVLLVEYAILPSDANIAKIWPKKLGFPSELPFDIELEKGFQATKVAKP